MTNKDSTSDGYCLQISNTSSLSCESDLSSFSFDKEIDTYSNRMDSDELPAFEIRLISPLGRTPSPIDSDLEFLSSPTHGSSCITPTRKTNRKPNQDKYKDSEDFVTLHDINAQISPPSDGENDTLNESSRVNSLETIFEGVFLNTPPRQKQKRTGSNGITRSNLLEKIAINRLNFVPAAASGKENVLQKDSSDNTPDD